MMIAESIKLGGFLSRLGIERNLASSALKASVAEDKE